MEPRLKRNLILVAGAHVALILVLLVSHWISLLIHRHKPKEVVTYVDLTTMVPDKPMPTAPPTPAPVVEEPPPAPEPEPAAPTPKPAIKPKKKKIEISKKRVRRSPDELPPPRKPERPRTSAEDVRKMLSPVLSSPSNATRNDFPFDWYISLVRRACYEVWEQPNSTTVRPGTVAVVSIRVYRDGAVREHQMIRPSGNAAMDESVLRAMKKLTRLKPLPGDYKGEFKDITIDFELAGNV